MIISISKKLKIESKRDAPLKARMTFLKTKKSLGLIGSFNSKHDKSTKTPDQHTKNQTDTPKVDESISTDAEYSLNYELIIPRKSKTASSDISVNSAKFSFASSIRSNISRISKKFRLSSDAVSPIYH